ncbi:cytochrome P450, partial [Lepidopterella palustris CBS 459.81]
EMEVNAGFILSAATEPVSDTLCGAVYLLAKHRGVLEKLQKEIESSVKSDKEITMSAFANMPYLHACGGLPSSTVLNEVMRCYTPTPAGARRKTPRGGATISGYYVPEGTIVCIYQYPAFTLPNNWAYPDKFIPERWLPTDHPDRPKATLSDKQDAFQPFGFGPKNCIGKALAYAEMKLIIARFVWHFDFELLDDGFQIEKQKIFLFRDRPPLNVKLSVRKH